MRLTLCHCDPASAPSTICDCPDLTVTAGLTVAEFRDLAAEVLDDRGLSTSALWSQGRQLPAHAVIGQPPLMHGGRVHTLPDAEYRLLTSGRALTGRHQAIVSGRDTGWLIASESRRERAAQWSRRRLRLTPHTRQDGVEALHAIRPGLIAADVPRLLEREHATRSPRRTQLISAGVAALMAIGIGLWTGSLTIAAMSSISIIPMMLGAGLFRRRSDRKVLGLTGHQPGDLLTRLLLRDQDPTARVPPPEPDALLAAFRSHADVAIVGSAAEREAVARLIICRWVEQTAHGQVIVDRGLHGLPQWRWARWLGSEPAPQDETAPEVLHVSSGTASGMPSRSQRPSAHTHHLCLADNERDVPAWCRVVVDAMLGTVTVGHRKFATDLTYPGANWADDVARLLASIQASMREHDATAVGADSAPAGTVSLLQTVGAPAPGSALNDWLDLAYQRDEHGDHPAGLTATIGVDATGNAVTIDLDRDGPHALIAGTTGAGKSQLLQTLIYGLALNARSDELALVLVDYKGGTSLGRCRDLPHVIGEVTDLDRSEALRALIGLRAEVQRREATIAAAGATDHREYAERVGTAALPRLVVIVDEFRAMADDLPEFMPELLTIAAQGRSLGIHLVLATQRPAGAIGPDIRANVALRLCLRVTDDSESHDVIGTHLAARLSPARPGLLYLRSGQDPVYGPVQTALSTRPPRDVASVYLAPYTQRHEDWRLDLSLPAPEIAEELAGAITAHHRRHGIAKTAAPWGAPLPRMAVRQEVLAGNRPEGGGLSVAVTDHPEVPCQRVFDWPRDSGILAVTGPGGSGKTTTVRSILQALRDSTDPTTVHVVSVNLDQGLEIWQNAHDGDSDASLIQPGSVMVVHDGPLLDTVVNWLNFDAAGDHLVVIDDADVVLETLERERLTGVADRLLALIKQPPPGVRVLTTWTRAPRAIIERCSTSIDLWGSGTESLDPRVPRQLVAGTGIPGRCLVIARETVAVGQVLAPDESHDVIPQTMPRWRPLPTHMELVACESDAIGVAGLDHAPLRMDVAKPLLITARKTEMLQRSVLTLLDRYGQAFQRCTVSSRRLDPRVTDELRRQFAEVNAVQPAQLQVADVIDPETLVIVVGDVATLDHDVQHVLAQQMASAQVGTIGGIILALTGAELMSGYGEPLASIRQAPYQLHVAPFVPELGELVPHEDRHLLSATRRPPTGRALYVSNGEAQVAQVALSPASFREFVDHSGGATGFSRAVIAG